jgi:hypothetical protein
MVKHRSAYKTVIGTAANVRNFIVNDAPLHF